ncbi:hypothetical protein KAJ89_03245 [Candidatus Parcubacteria bacterium]|nr:hypothetical protein [Candidatus Parcubacteria bacterium]
MPKNKSTNIFRIILKDTEGRAVAFDIEDFDTLGTGAQEKKLVKKYDQLLVEEKKYKKDTLEKDKKSKKKDVPKDLKKA